VHDFFDVLGLPDGAHPLDVRRVSARYVRRSHPDFRFGLESRADVPPHDSPLQDAAVDYIDPVSLIDRIQSAFFAGPR
jgi:hypothetical protein